MNDAFFHYNIAPFFLDFFFNYQVVKHGCVKFDSCCDTLSLDSLRAREKSWL